MLTRPAQRPALQRRTIVRKVAVNIVADYAKGFHCLRVSIRAMVQAADVPAGPRPLKHIDGEAMGLDMFFYPTKVDVELVERGEECAH